jgi:hypothetical protein
LKKKKNIYHLKTNTDEHYALHVAREIIKRNSVYTLVNYIIWSWESKPKLKKSDLLNVITEEYLNKQKVKNEKTNIVKFDRNQLN